MSGYRQCSAASPRVTPAQQAVELWGIDRRWRRFAVKQITCSEQGAILDVATGTGDVALEIAAQTPASVRIVGVDFCKEMVELGIEKVNASPHARRITMEVAPCEAIPYPAGNFDAVTIAFGIRNVVDRFVGLKEMNRVLKPGGKVSNPGVSTPSSRLFKSLYSLLSQDTAGHW